MNSRWDEGAYPPREHSGQREILVGGWRPLPVTVAESECPSRGGFWFGRARPLGSEPRVHPEEAAVPVASRKELSEGLSTSRDPAQRRGSTDAQPPAQNVCAHVFLCSPVPVVTYICVHLCLCSPVPVLTCACAHVCLCSPVPVLTRPQPRYPPGPPPALPQAPLQALMPAHRWLLPG